MLVGFKVGVKWDGVRVREAPSQDPTHRISLAPGHPRLLALTLGGLLLTFNLLGLAERVPGAAMNGQRRQ